MAVGCGCRSLVNYKLFFEFIKAPHKSLQKTPKEAPKTTPKKPKIQIENRRKRHRDSDSTDATLKQDYVENDLGPAECAERSRRPTGDGVLDTEA